MCNNSLLINLLNKAIQECYQKDSYLIEHSMEQACVARIFYYMQTLINTKPEYKCLRTYNLDCEYNKNCTDIKETPRCPKGTKPDLIIHKRGNNDNNLLIIEFKSHSSKLRKYKDFGVSKDVIKLEDFTSNYKYNYQLGVLVKLKIDGAKYSYFINGIETKVNCYE